MKQYTLTLNREDVITLGMAIGQSAVHMITAEDDEIYGEDIKRLAKLAKKFYKATGWMTVDMQDLIDNYGG